MNQIKLLFGLQINDAFETRQITFESSMDFLNGVGLRVYTKKSNLVKGSGNQLLPFS